MTNLTAMVAVYVSLMLELNEGLSHKVRSRAASKMIVSNRYPWSRNDGRSDFECSRAERAHSTRLVANDITEAAKEGCCALGLEFVAQRMIKVNWRTAKTAMADLAMSASAGQQTHPRRKGTYQFSGPQLIPVDFLVHATENLQSPWGDEEERDGRRQREEVLLEGYREVEAIATANDRGAKDIVGT